MRFFRGIAIVLFVTAIGALIPFAFREGMGMTLASSVVCDMLATGARLGHIDADKRKLLLDAAAGSSDADAKSKAIVEHARTGCR
jgi:hypothetical protein